MGQMFGADIRQLRELATTFTGAARTIDTTVTSLRPALSRAGWTGPDARRFGHEWFGRLAPQLSDAARRLTTAAGVLKSDADEQERASDSGSVVGASGGGGNGDGGGSADRTESGFPTTGTAWFGGDSFASGEGIYDYDEDTDLTGSDKTADTNLCHRSPSSYQAQVFDLAQSEGAFAGQDYASEACSGAVVSDLYSDNADGNAGEGPQMYSQEQDRTTTERFDNIPADASLITLSLGGNDVQFAEVLKNCVTEVFGSGCQDSATIQDRIDTVYGVPGLQGSLEQQIAKVQSEHPDARIVLVGYPQLFSAEEDMKNGWITTMSVAEQKWANEMSGSINTAGSAMAERLGVEWLDPTSAYVGDGYDHRIGSDEPYLNGLNMDGLNADRESFHPNQDGHDAMTDLFLEQIRNGQR